MPDLHGKKLKKISFEDWYEQNEEYLNDEWRNKKISYNRSH
jgi:hypothetical protein